MNNKNLIIVILLISISVISYYVYKTFGQETEIVLENIVTTTKQDIDFDVPDGWFVNIKQPDILLTKHEVLPEIGNTETYAYGDSISITNLIIENSPEEWIEQRFPNEDPSYKSKEWIEISGNNIFEVRSEAGGASGDVLSYYYFNDNQVTIFSLYTIDISSNAGVKNKSDLIKIISSYFNK